MQGDAADPDSDETAQEGEHQALGEKLADDAAPARAEGETHRDLPAAGGRAGEEQVCDVDAGDQQDESHGGQQRHQRRAAVAKQGLLQAAHRHGPVGLERGIQIVDALFDRGELRGRLFRGGAGLQASERVVT